MASLTGTITQQNGKPLASVAVSINGKVMTRSDKYGKYNIRGLRIGPAVVKFTKAGYQTIIK
jgi:hypothetical protein